MFCLIAFIVLAILGIFSATHRALAKEAFACVFRRVTFRPCETDFKERMKGRVVGKVFTKSTFFARILNRHFELISWIFFILSLVTVIFLIRGGYNYYMYGSCNGLNQSGFCAFDPKGENNKVTQVSPAECSINGQAPTEKDLTLNGVDLSFFPTKNSSGEEKLVFIGCYTCDYTRKAYPEIQKLLNNNVSYTFAHFPANEQTKYLSAVGYCAVQQSEDKFWQLNDLLFASDEAKLLDKNYVLGLLPEVGIDQPVMQKCLADPKTGEEVDKQISELEKTHLYGTPTIFINGEPLVGPKPTRIYKRLLHEVFLGIF